MYFICQAFFHNKLYIIFIFLFFFFSSCVRSFLLRLLSRYSLKIKRVSLAPLFRACLCAFYPFALCSPLLKPYFKPCAFLRVPPVQTFATVATMRPFWRLLCAFCAFLRALCVFGFSRVFLPLVILPPCPLWRFISFFAGVHPKNF